MVKPFLLMFKILHCTKTCRLPLKPRKIPLFSLKRLCFTKRLRFTFVFVCFFPFPSSLFSFTDPYCYLGRQCFSISVSVLFLHCCFLSKLAQPEMDLRESLVLLLVGSFVVQFCCNANANLVFPVERKFKGPVENLAAIKAHDAGRRGRFLSVVDVALGGNGRPTSNGLALLLPLPSLFILFFRMHFNCFFFVQPP